jgi:adenosylhomocysteine nucleosidase
MPVELRPLVRRLHLKQKRGRLGSIDVVSAIIGIGTERAAEATTRLLRDEPVDHVIVIGVAGGIDRSFPLGSVMIPTLVMNAATSVSYQPHPLGHESPRGILCTTDDFIKDHPSLMRLRDDGVAALDMETAAVARVCEERGRPWSVFRAISDDAFDPEVDEAILGLTRPDGSAEMKAVARYIAGNPMRVRLLARLARDSKTATTAAVDAALAACGAAWGQSTSTR